MRSYFPFKLSAGLVVALSGLASPAFAKLVAHYPLDELAADGDRVVDVVGGNDGTLISAATVVREEPSPKPHLGTATRFGLNDGAFIGPAPAVRPSDKFTICWWMRPETLNNFDRLYESLAGTGNGGNGIRIDLGGAPGDSVRVLLRDGNGATNTQLTHSLGLVTGTWYFFAVRYDSSLGDGSALKITVLENAAGPIGAAEISAATEQAATLGTGPIDVHATGAFIAADDAAASGANDFDGAMDDIGFFDDSDGNGILSDENLAQVFNSGVGSVKLINEFTSDVTSVAPGGDVVLSWEVVPGFDSLQIDNGVGDVGPVTDAVTGIGSTTANPNETTVYTLRVADDNGSFDSKSLTVLVGSAPQIDDFSVSGSNLVEAGQPATLVFDVLGADALTITPGEIDVTGQDSVQVTADETTTFELTAANAFGSAAANITLVVFPFPPPASRFDAGNAANTDASWTDELGSNNWALTGAVRDAAIVSPGTTITAAYRLTAPDLTQGGAAGGFPVGDRSIEVWICPGAIDSDYQVVFENGGGQNGSAILINETEVRFLGHAGGVPGGPDVRKVDFAIPIEGVETGDFLQIVYVIGDTADTVDLYVNDTAGNSLSASAAGDVSRGGNGAGLFTYASGGLGTTPNNLGGHTEDPAIQLTNLAGFAGKIALLNIYAMALSAEEVQAAFEFVALPVRFFPFAITDVSLNASGATLSVTWNSRPGRTYAVDTSTDLSGWSEFDDSVDSGGTSTSLDLPVPRDTAEWFVRVRAGD